MKFRIVAQTGSPVTSIPGTLLPITPWNELNANLTRIKNISGSGTVDMGNFPINGEQFSMMVINDTMYLNDIELWRVSNNSNFGHPMHIHDVSFYILRRDGMPPPPYERGLKDVVMLMPGDTVEYITKFEHFTNDTIPYMFHCHNLAHEDMGMMTSFIVILPPVGVEAQTDFIGLSLYPNPGSDQLTLTWNNAGLVNKETTIHLLDVRGKLLQSKIVPLSTYFNEVKMDLSDLSAGIYFMQLSNGKELVTRKFVKLR